MTAFAPMTRPNMFPVTLPEHEEYYEKHGLPFGWCKTCDKLIWTTYGKEFHSIIYSLPEGCKKHDAFVKVRF